MTIAFRFISPAALLLAAGLSLCSWQTGFSAEMEVMIREGTDPGSYRLSGGFNVRASTEAVWDVLTDYEGIGRFVSAVESSRILKRGPRFVIIEQEGTGRFLFFARRVKLILVVRENRPYRIDFENLGDSEFRRYRGSWKIDCSFADCDVAYELEAWPNSSLGPKFAARRVLEKNALRQLQEVRSEIERRASAPEKPF